MVFNPVTEGVLFIGRKVENNSRLIQIDVSTLLQYTGKTINLMLCRPGEYSFYPVVSHLNEGILEFTPTNGDLKYTGYGRWEIWVGDSSGFLLKPYAGKTNVFVASDTEGDAPGAGEDWAVNTLHALNNHTEDHQIHVSPEDREKWNAGRGTEWGQITGEIQNQSDLAQVFAAYSDEIDSKVTNNGTGMSGALNNLDFNSNPILDDTQIIIQDSATKWVRRKADMIWQWMRAKIFSAFVSVNPQELTEEQQAQARANINVPLGGDRHLAQNASEGYISIASATSFETGYKCPCDGKVQIRKNGGTAYLHEDNYTVMSVTDGTTCSWVTQGSVVWHTGTPNAVNFIPYAKGALK